MARGAVRVRAHEPGQLASNLTLSRYVPAHRLGLSFGIKQAAIPLATLLAGAAVPAVALTLGWRWAYGIGAVLALAALLISPRDTVGRERTPATPGERATGALSVIGSRRASRPARRRRWGSSWSPRPWTAASTPPRPDSP